MPIQRVAQIQHITHSSNNNAATDQCGCQLSPILMSIQMGIQKLVQNQKTITPAPTPLAAPIAQSAEPIREDLAQGATQTQIIFQQLDDLLVQMKAKQFFVTKAEATALVR